MSEPSQETVEMTPETKSPGTPSAPETQASVGPPEAPPEAEIPDASIRVTTAALEVLEEMIAEADLPEEGGLRLSAGTGAGCSAPMTYDMALEPGPGDDDAVLEVRGVRIFMDPESAWVLDGLLVDYVTDSPMGEGFAFQHPRGAGGRSC